MWKDKMNHFSNLKTKSSSDELKAMTWIAILTCGCAIWMLLSLVWLLYRG